MDSPLTLYGYALRSEAERAGSTLEGGTCVAGRTSWTSLLYAIADAIASGRLQAGAPIAWFRLARVRRQRVTAAMVPSRIYMDGRETDFRGIYPEPIKRRTLFD
jgi:hypothetical protein